MRDPVTRLNAALEGRYSIDRQLGEGGMATVYLAQDLRHERKVALKVLKPELASVVGAERFLAEIKTTASLQHPHILPLFDSGEADGFLFYAMPYVQGESLRERLGRERQLPVDEAVRITVSVTEALDHAHRQGVIHRDIKPANILLQDGKPVVSDFGIALAVNAAGEGRLTETGMSLGTPHYMSPEQATGDQSVGPATDIWAAGCVLYEMLAGEPPYQGATPQAILGRIVTGDPRPITDERRAVPPNVRAAIEKALEKVPADRFLSVAAFGQALTDPRFRHGAEPLAAGGRRAQAAVVAASLLIGIALGWAVHRSAGRSESIGSLAGGIIEYTIGGSNPGTLGRAVALSPDGELVAHSGPDFPLSIRNVRRSDRDVRVITPEVQSLQFTSPFFSPDGEQVAFITFGSLFRAPAAGGPSELVAALGSSRTNGGTWTDQGEVVFASDAGLFRVPIDGGAVEPLAEPDSTRGELLYGWPESIGGSDWILFTILPRLGSGADANASIGAMNLRSRERKIVLRGGSSPRLTDTGHLIYSSGGRLRIIGFDPFTAEPRGEPVVTDVTGIEMIRGVVADYDVGRSGTLIYRPRGGRLRELIWVDRSGAPEVVANLGVDSYNWLRLSPDGTRISFDMVADDGGRDLYVWDLPQERMRRLTNTPTEENFAVWSPRGDTIYFTTQRENALDGALTMDIYKRAADGTGASEPVYQGPNDQWIHSVSPDGSLLFANQAYPGGPDYDLITITTSEPVRVDTILATPAIEAQAVAHPGGEFVAYVSDAEGPLQVYLGRLNRMETDRWPVSINGGGHPLWSPDGSELYFRDLEGAVWVVGVSLTPDVNVGRPVRLFDSPDERFTVFPSGTAFAVSPLDGRFLMRRDLPEDSRLRVVLNWVQDAVQGVP